MGAGQRRVDGLSAYGAGQVVLGGELAEYGTVRTVLCGRTPRYTLCHGAYLRYAHAMTNSVKAESLNGSIEFLGNGVIIKTKGGSKTIPLGSIQGVEFKKAGIMAGYLRLSVAGAQGVKSRNKTQQLSRDTDAVQFSKASKNAEFEAVADAINRALLS